MKKKKICVIFTGGTIGSDSNGATVSLSGGSKKMLLEKYRMLTDGKDGKGSVQFDELSPINILSENVQPSDLKALYGCVKGVNTADYDGIIITHGTDTLCFTVNLFSLLFCDCPVPVVFVSSLYPLTDSRNNGVKNFAGAVDFIENVDFGGVFCAFANDGENCKIHLGSRLVYPDEINGFYHSALKAHLAEIDGGKVILNKSPLLPDADSLKKGGNAIPFAIDDRVLLITMRSLLNFTVYDFSHVKPRAVIVELSHSGTVCTEGGDLNFKNFAAYCKKHGVPVIIAPVMSRAGVYASMSDVPDNVIFAYDATVEMTITKVMCALGANLQAGAYLESEIAFEKIPFPIV